MRIQPRLSEPGMRPRETSMIRAWIERRLVDAIRRHHHALNHDTTATVRKTRRRLDRWLNIAYWAEVQS